MTRSATLLAAALLLSVPTQAQSYFNNCIKDTGSDATIVVDASGNHVVGNGTLQPGDGIGIFTEDGQCVGADVWTGQNIAITVWGDDPIQPDKYGLIGEESFLVRVWDKSANQLYGTSYGTVTFEMDPNAPFLPSKNYINNGLYMATGIQAVPDQVRGKNKVRTRSPKKNATERGVSNTAMFSITRTGPFNDPLTVDYAINGTATNGTDYEALSTSVNFEPGQKTAYLIVVPIEDNLNEGVETVELTLIGRDTYDVVSDSVFASVTIEDGGSALGVEGEAPGTFYLSAPYPNPFSVRTAFKLAVSETQPIRVDVYNVIGKRVASVFDGTVQAGIDYEFLVDGEGLPNGLYMIKVSGRDASVRSVVLQR